jgi:hypothetical protein
LASTSAPTSEFGHAAFAQYVTIAASLSGSSSGASSRTCVWGMLIAPGRCASARSRVAPLLARFARWQPDLVVHEQSELAAPIVAALCGVPAVLHGWGPTLPASLIEGGAAALDALGRSFGVEDVSAAVRSSTYVDVCPPGLQLPGVAGWSDVVRLRPCSAGSPHTAPDSVYVTLGTVVNKVPGVLETLVAGVSALGVKAIVTVGPDVDPARLGPVLAHVRVERYVAQELVLPRCRAVVSHAGAGTTLGALAHGLPQVDDALAQLLARKSLSACSVDGNASSAHGRSAGANARTSVASSVVCGA